MLKMILKIRGDAARVSSLHVDLRQTTVVISVLSMVPSKCDFLFHRPPPARRSQGDCLFMALRAFFFSLFLSPSSQETGSEGDKGVLAVPVEYGADEEGAGAGAGAPRIDWAAVEAANAGVHLPDETEEHYTSRILFSRVRERATEREEG